MAPSIISQLTTSAITLEALLFQHLLHSNATLKQRAAVLKLLHMSLAPHLDFASPIAKQPANGMSNSSSSSANASAAGPAESAQTQSQAGFQGSVEPKAGGQHESRLAGQAQLDTKSAGSQQLRIQLFTMVLEALPSVIKAAACRSSSETASEATPPAAQADAQTVENQTQQEQQDSGAEAIDGNAMQALLSLMLHVATNIGLQGMRAVLAFPTALGPILPELLATSQVSCSFASSAIFFLIMAHFTNNLAKLRPTVHSWGKCCCRRR